jgi:hypothetical protein
VKSVLAGGNAAAKVKLLELSFAWEQAQQGLAELQYEEIDRKTSMLDNLACQLMDDVEAEERRKAQVQAENITLMQERRELERLRDELRAAVAAEADVAGFDLVDDDEPEGVSGAVAAEGQG